MYTLYRSPGRAALAPHGVFEESGANDRLGRIELAAGRREAAARQTPQQTQPA